MVEPQIYVTQNFNQHTPRWWMSRNFIMIVVGVVILVEGVWAGYTLIKPVTKSEINKSLSGAVTKPESEASITITGDKEVKVGNVIKADVVIDSNSLIDGVDLLVKYDPKFLEPIDSSSPMKLGTLFGSYPVNAIDSQGLITISGAAQKDNEAFKGTNTFGSISFRAKQAGSTTVSLDFTPQSTKDTNIIESSSGNDILKKVSNLELNITK